MLTTPSLPVLGDIDNEIAIHLADRFKRLNTLYKIINRRGQLIPFKMNPAQTYFIKNMAHRNVILKSRRLGFTTLLNILGLDSTLFNLNFFALILSYDEESSKNVFDSIIDFNWQHFDPFLKEKYSVDTSNAKKLKFNLGQHQFSEIMVKTTGRGAGLNFIHVSELGRIAKHDETKAREIFTGTIPALTPDGFLAIESTAEGEDNMFYDVFMEAYQNPEDYKRNKEALKPFFFNWQWDKELISTCSFSVDDLPRDFLDYQRKHNELATQNPLLYKKITDQELNFFYSKFLENKRDWTFLLENYPTRVEEAFATTGRKFFPMDICLKQEVTLQKPLRQEGDWIFYEDPDPRSSYIVGVDVSEGIGKDHSAIVILKLSKNKKLKVVATYKNQFIAPDTLAYEIKNKATLFSSAMVVVELNNMGHTTVTTLKDIYSPDLIFRIVKDDKEEAEQTERLGLLVTGKVKNFMFSELKTLLTDEEIVICSAPLLSEVKMYDQKQLRTTKKNPNATNHFDLLTALALAVYGAHYSSEFEMDEIKVFNVNSLP